MKVLTWKIKISVMRIWSSASKTLRRIEIYLNPIQFLIKTESQMFNLFPKWFGELKYN